MPLPNTELHTNVKLCSIDFRFQRKNNGTVIEMVKDYFFVECGERISSGKKILAEYLADVDEEKVESFVAEQVELVGGKPVFDIIDRNLKTGDIELSLLQELCDLYGWRRKFFDDNLPVLKGSWFTDSFCRDVIVFQVTNNFDQMLRIACSNMRKENSFPSGIFLAGANDSMAVRKLRYRIDNLEVLYNAKGHFFWRNYYLTEMFLPGSYLHFSDVARIIIEHHSKAPRRLEELAMTRARRSGVSRDQMTRAVVANDRVGFYTPEDDVPAHLTDEGRDLYELLKTMFFKIKETVDPSLASPI